MNFELERALTFDLQFFAGEDGVEPAPETDGTPAPEPGGSVQPQTDSEEYDFIDPSLVPDEVKNQDYFKGMKKAYTQKTQEIAEYKKACEQAGIDPKSAGQIINALASNPEKFLEMLAAERGLALTPKEKRELKKEIQDLTDGQEDEIGDEDEYEKQILKKAEERVAKKFQPLLNEYQESKKAEAKKFFSEVTTAIDQVLKDFPESGVTKDQLFAQAKANRIAPENMQLALAHALGPKKYQELLKKQALADIQKTAKENKGSVSPTLSGTAGTEAKILPEKPKSISDVTQMLKDRLSNRIK